MSKSANEDLSSYYISIAPLLLNIGNEKRPKTARIDICLFWADLLTTSLDEESAMDITLTPIIDMNITILSILWIISPRIILLKIIVTSGTKLPASPTYTN